MIQTETLFEKIKVLPPQRVAEVIDFVDFLVQKEEKRLIDSVMKLSEKSFAKVWDNDEDSVYNEL